VTLDVVGLYSKIPHHEVTTSLTETLADNDHLETQAPPTHLLLEIVEQIFHNNVFEFDGEIFRQILGTAVGTPMAPSIANVFMGWQQLLSQSPGHTDTRLWKRFIDDIVMLWFKGEQQLLDFMDWLNDQHPTIKFMANYGTVDIPYLDVSLSIADGHISTDLHVKELGVKHQLTYSRQGDR